MMDHLEAAKVISRHRGHAIVVATMQANVAWAKASTNPDFDLMFTGAMGKASSMGLGLALARPDMKVIVLDGDGSLLMNLGTLVTIAAMAPPNLVHIVFDDSVYHTSGNQPVPRAGHTSLTGMAKAAGYPSVHEFTDPESLGKNLESIMAGSGPAFICLKIEVNSGSFLQAIGIKKALPRFREAMRRTGA